MSKIILWHGTSELNAKRIEQEGFITDKNYNWNVHSKKGFVYLSKAYAPFYAMNNKGNKLAIIKVEVDSHDLYPEDDFLMKALGKYPYNQEDLDKIKFRVYKKFWKESLKYLGNAAIKPMNIKVLGVRYFDGKKLLLKCDPVISSANFQILGDYYEAMTEWLYNGNDIMNFPNFGAWTMNMSDQEFIEKIKELKTNETDRQESS